MDQVTKHDAEQGTNDHKRKFDDRRNNNNTNYPNNHDNNNYPNNHDNNNYPNDRNNNNYQNNRNNNNNNRNNDYHHQQNGRHETFRTYGNRGYNGPYPLCRKCTLNHTGPCTVRRQNCNKKKEEYDIWAIEMEHYLEYIDNDVWKVIHNGNSKKRISTGKDGVVRIIPPVFDAKIHAVEKERKARTILLMAIPKEHLRRFHGMDDAKEIWELVQKRLKRDMLGSNNITLTVGKPMVRKDLDLLHEDLEQIDDVDIRMKKLYKKTGRRVQIDGNKPVGFDKKKLKCFKCHNTGHFARECTTVGKMMDRRVIIYQDQELERKNESRTVC
ncbi:ribonuclease H-like domain-containing protein [Tanacetum coccineum]